MMLEFSYDHAIDRILAERCGLEWAVCQFAHVDGAVRSALKDIGQEYSFSITKHNDQVAFCRRWSGTFNTVEPPDALQRKFNAALKKHLAV